jgi:hypothetical protein
MSYDRELLDRIFARTSGYCHICGHKLCRKNYAKVGLRGAWEVEHSVAQCKGGGTHCNNLYAAHISCNRSKGRLTTRTARRRHERTRAPMSIERRAVARRENTTIGIIGGGLTGLAVGGPLGAVVGMFAGGNLGHSLNPDETG